MSKKNQSNRLTTQQKESKGVVGIFGEGAKIHDMTVGDGVASCREKTSRRVSVIGISI